MQIDPRRQQAAVSSQEAERAIASRKPSASRASRRSASRDLLAAGAISKQELEQAGDRAADGRSEPEGARSPRCSSKRCSCELLYTVSRADVRHHRRRAGAGRYQVTPQTVLTTIDQNETLEVHIAVPIERACGAEERPANLAFSAAMDSSQLATTKVRFISPHVDDQAQSILVKGIVPNPGSAACAPRSTCVRGSSGRRPKGWWCR